MKILTLAFILAAGAMPALEILADDAPPPNRIIIANDTCPDVTWGFTEAQTRQAFADLIAAHLDEMTRTGGRIDQLTLGAVDLLRDRAPSPRRAPPCPLALA